MKNKEEKNQDVERLEREKKQLLAELNDPNALARKMEAAGFEVKRKKTPEEVEEESLKAPELPKIDIDFDDENLTPKQVFQRMNEAYGKTFKDMQDFMEKSLTLATKKTKRHVDESKAEIERRNWTNKVNEFAKTHPDIEKFAKEMDRQLAAGYTLEESYENAKKLSGESATPSKKEEKKERKESSHRTDAEDIDDEDLDKKPKGVRESAAKNLEELLSKRKDSDEEEDEDEDIE